MAHLTTIGPPRHEGEASAIRFLQRHLPPEFHLYANVHLATGRRVAETYEHDVIAVCPHGVNTIECKSYGGRIEGNRDRWRLADGAWVSSPIPLTEHKARVLKTLIASKGDDLRTVWVQGLIFVSPPDADPQITPNYQAFVHTRRTIVKALSDPDWFGSACRLDFKQQARVGKVITDGGTPASAINTVGDYDLLERLPSPGALYTAWVARDRTRPLRRVLHVYELDAEDPEAAERLRVQALREATLHDKLWGVRDILQMKGHFTAHDPLRVVLSFEDVVDWVTLTTWLGENPRASLSTRLRLGARVAAALAAVHKAGVVHRRLSTDVVLVDPTSEPENLRVCAFELGKDLLGSTATVSGSLLRNPAWRCVAPEVLKLGETTPLSDLFNLGALLYELFSGETLFRRPDEVLAPFTVGPVAHLGQPVPEPLQQLVESLLEVEPRNRPGDAASVANRLETFERPAGAPTVDRPGALKPGEVLRDQYELIETIGRGEILWLGQRGTDGTVFRGLTAIVCCDWCREVADLSSSVRVESKERVGGVRKRYSSESVRDLAWRWRRRTLTAARQPGGAVFVVPYVASSRIERELTAVVPRERLLSPPGALVDQLSDKRYQRCLFGRWGLSSPRSRAVRPGATSVPFLRFDAQVPRGSLGVGTSMGTTAAELTEAFRSSGAGELLVSEWLEGVVLNVNACVDAASVSVSWPSVQLTGCEPCAPPSQPFAYCGNDFGAAVRLDRVVPRVVDLSEQLGEQLREMGYRGLFGIDFLTNGQEVWVLELNPRFQGSTPLVAWMESGAGQLSVAERHVAAFVGERIPPATPEACGGAQVVLYHQSDRRAVVGADALAPRGYRLFGFPVAGTVVEPGAILGRIVADHGVLAADLRSLTSEAEQAVESVRTSLALGKLPGTQRHESLAD